MLSDDAPVQTASMDSLLGYPINAETLEEHQLFGEHV